MTKPQLADSSARQFAVSTTMPELDENTWRAWQENNRAKDRIKSARRKRLLGALLVLLIVGLLAIQMLSVAQ